MLIAISEVQVLVQVQERALCEHENFLFQIGIFFFNVPVTSQMKDKIIDDCETILYLHLLIQNHSM